MDPKAFWTSLPRAARLYLTVVGAVGVAGTAAVVTGAATGTPLLAAAPSPSPSPGAGTNYCNRFTGHLAANLGKSQSQVQQAISQAVSQTIDDAVKNGDLTQSQANAIKSKVGSNASGAQCALGTRGIPRIGRGGFGPFLGGLRFNELDEVAKVLGISTSQLQQDLRNGQTVQQLATAKGMDEATFQSKLASQTKTDLDQQVKAGSMTQNQENAILQRIQTGTPPLWNGMPRPRFGRPPAPNASPSPPAAPVPSPSATP
jgi:uncharacterized protein YidB (DUF937 family)